MVTYIDVSLNIERTGTGALKYRSRYFSLRVDLNMSLVCTVYNPE